MADGLVDLLAGLDEALDALDAEFFTVVLEAECKATLRQVVADAGVIVSLLCRPGAAADITRRRGVAAVPAGVGDGRRGGGVATVQLGG